MVALSDGERCELDVAGTQYATIDDLVGYCRKVAGTVGRLSLGVFGTAGGLFLWVLELFAAILGCAYLWELCDALGREAWLRRIRDGATPEQAAVSQPFVSFHVPAHNEPPDMVIETLESLVAMDYPNFEIIAIDDNTDDESLWRPVEQWCAAHGLKFVHLEDWPGYKSGALNYALEQMVDPRTELIGVIDADYQLDPTFLAASAPLFADPEVGFIQSPQDYRDWEQAPFYRRLFYSYRYFFAVSQPSRNERDGAIFAGTMAGASGASPRTPSSPSGCCATAGPVSTWTGPSARASCRSPSRP